MKKSHRPLKGAPHFASPTKTWTEFLTVSSFVLLNFANPIAKATPVGNLSACTPMAAGDVSSTTSPIQGKQRPFTMNFDNKDWSQNKIVKLDIIDVESQQSTHIETRRPVLPLAVDQNLERILMTSFENGNMFRKFFLIRKDGTIIQEFEGLREFNSIHASPLDNNIYFNRNLDQIVMEFNKHVMVYLIQQKKWVTLFKVPEDQSLLGQLREGTRSGFQNLLLSNDGSFLTIGIQKLSPVPKSHFFIFDLKQLKILNQIELESVNSLIYLQPSQIAMKGPSGEIQVLDLIQGTIRKIDRPTPIKNNSTLFAGPNNSIGIAGNGDPETYTGFIEFYSPQGSLIFRQKIPAFQFLTSLGDGRTFFLQEARTGKTYLYQIRTNTLMLWPDMLGNLPEIYSSQMWKIKNHIYHWSMDNSTLKSLKYEIKKQCLEEVLKFHSSSKNSIQLLDGNSLGYMHLQDAIANKLVSEDPNKNSLPPDEGKRKLLQSKALDLLSIILGVGSFSGSYSYRPNPLTAHRQIGVEYLKPLAPLLQQIPESEKEGIIDNIAIQWTEQATPLIDEQKMVDKSKIANMFVSILKPIFMSGSFPRTDFIFKQKNNQIIPMIMTDGPVDNETSTLNPHGFGLKNLPPFDLSIGETKDFEFQWLHHQKKWKAVGKISKLSLKHLINTEPGPRYQELWKDRAFTGAVILSSNLGGHRDALGLVRKYVTYFRDQGFSFGVMMPVVPDDADGVFDKIKKAYLFPTRKEILSDFSGWLQTRIESNELDYLIKEAHGGGNEAFIIMANENWLLQGTKSLPDGKVERVYIVYPKPEFVDNSSSHPTDSTALYNSTLGKWLQTRQLNNGTQFVYFNASCWSYTKALREIIAAKNHLLVEIPTDAGALTFSNSGDNHLQALLTDFRNHKNYSEIDQHLNSIQPESGARNPYLFPNGAKFQNLIWNQIGTALDYSVEVAPVE